MAEAGWTEEDLLAQSRRKSERDSNATNKELIAIWREIEKNDNAWPFRDAVDTQEVVDYNKVVAHPIGEYCGEGREGRGGLEAIPLFLGIPVCLATCY